MVDPPAILYTVSNVLFHKYGGSNVGVTNFLLKIIINIQELCEIG